MRTAPPGQLPTSNLLLMVVDRSQKPRSRGGGGACGNMLGARIKIGALDGGPQCHMSNLRIGYVDCHYFSNLDVNFEMV